MTDWIPFKIEGEDILIHVKNISDMRYNSHTRTMTITMTNNSVFTRSNVSIEDFNELRWEVIND